MPLYSFDGSHSVSVSFDEQDGMVLILIDGFVYRTSPKSAFDLGIQILNEAGPHMSMNDLPHGEVEEIDEAELH